MSLDRIFAMTRRLRGLVLLFCLIAGALASAPEWREQIDLSQFFRDSAALKRLAIAYSQPDKSVLYVFGDGRVVKQATAMQMSETAGLRPTCSGTIGEEEVRRLITVFVDHHFFALPIRHYLFQFVGGNAATYVKPVEELKLHSIMVTDGNSIASRDFAAGVYQGQQEAIPPDFAAIENALQQVEREGIKPVPCHIEPAIKFP